MKRAILIVTAIFFFTICKAQLSTVEKIRAHYTKINTAIASAVKNKTSMYCNEVVINKNNTVWPDVGVYQKTTSFWYSEDVEGMEEEDPKTALEKVTVKTISSDTKSSEEYLFYEGELVFYYYYTSYKTDAGPQRDEHRVYFNKGKLLKHDISKGSMDMQPETKKAVADDALLQAKKLQQLFKLSGDHDDVAAG